MPTDESVGYFLSPCQTGSDTRKAQQSFHPALLKSSLLAVLACGFLGSSPAAVVSTNARCELRLELGEAAIQAQLRDRATGQVWADVPYHYWLRLETGTEVQGLSEPTLRATHDGAIVTGKLKNSGLMVTHRFVLPKDSDWLEEKITLQNRGKQPLAIADLGFGFQRRLDESVEKMRWVAVPFRRQADGKLHDYSSAELRAGKFGNSDWRNDACVADQNLSDQAKLRSEAWAWTDGERGLLIAKYSPEMIEYSITAVERGPNALDARLRVKRQSGPLTPALSPSEGERETSLALGGERRLDRRPFLRFGGAGLALYREPRAATLIAAGASVTFGVTRYVPFDGGWPRGYGIYREFLDERGHRLPPEYRPPLNWNELFDVGWYHSDRAQLFQHYTREALLREAAKAKDIGCDLLYLDPGWEICEGTTLWDTERLGKVEDFAHELKARFRLGLGYRTIGRVYREEFPKPWHLRREKQGQEYQRPLLLPQPEPEPVPLAAVDGRRNLALLPEARASASSIIAGYPELHQVSHLNDGWYNNPASWVSAGEPSWIEIDLGAEYLINEIALGSEHTPQFNDRAVRRFEVSVAGNEERNPKEGRNPKSKIRNPWAQVLAYDGKPVHRTEHFRFEPVLARGLRVSILAAEAGAARIDELEIYEAKSQPNATPPVRSAPPKPAGGAPINFWEVCTQSRAWQREKLKRILAITGGGVEFMMFDEFDWRGPCFDPAHGHPVPSTPEGHVRAVYGLIEAMRARYPRVLVEAHDPVWPWGVRYVPTYFQQGFGGNHYQENWGFEFMWNPIEDLRSGRALCLYYYNLGCDIPLYDHLTMEGDNDACLAFWWYASTVRHLGIGGKKGLNSKQENETRYAAYKKAVAKYNGLREFFAQGRFIGLDETAHLHLHPREPAAVVNLFNLTDKPVHRELRLSARELGWENFGSVRIQGAQLRHEAGGIVLEFDLPPLSPGLAVMRKGN